MGGRSEASERPAVGTLRRGTAPAPPPAAAAEVDGDEDGADDDVAPADDVGRVGRLRVVERPSAPAPVEDAEPEPSHHGALSPAEVGASVSDLDPLDVQLVPVVDEDPHGAVDPDEEAGTVEPDGVLVPGHGVLRPGPRAPQDQFSPNGLLVELRGDTGHPGLLTHLGNDVGDGLHTFLGDLLLLAGGQAAPDDHLGSPEVAAGPQMPGDSPGAA